MAKLLLFSVTFSSLCISLCSGDMSTTLSHCCDLGTAWSKRNQPCDAHPTPTGIDRHHQAICASTLAICCLRTYREKMCAAGIESARVSANCLAITKIGGEYFKDCCDACKLGIAVRNRSGSCHDSTFHLGLPWDVAFRQCCTNNGHIDVGSSGSGLTKRNVTLNPLHPNPLPVDVVGTSGVSSSECGRHPRGQLCDHKCVDSPQGYYCECHPGYRLHADGKSCIFGEASRCQLNNPCEQLCEDTGDAIVCTCRPGFQLNSDGQTCTDVDECVLPGHRHDCNLSQERCVNTVGGYDCVNLWNNSVSHRYPSSNQVATNPSASGSHSRCPSGYEFNHHQQECEDMDECAVGVDACNHSTQFCTNTIGSYVCVIKHSAAAPCPPGYKFLSNNCVDVDECAEELDACNRHREFCINLVGTYECQPKTESTCPAGYKFNSYLQSCEDVDECHEKLDDCDVAANETCRNVAGGYECDLRCDRGFRFVAHIRTCLDIDECAEGLDDCRAEISEVCVNTEGNFQCLSTISGQIQCDAGYKPERGRCVDVDECLETSEACDTELENCVNEIGYYRCIPKDEVSTTATVEECPEGYRLDFIDGDRGRCVDVDECAKGLHHCRPPNANCVNLLGSYTCELAPCQQGYRRHPETNVCQDVDECSENLSNCSRIGEDCLNRDGGFECRPKTVQDCPGGHRYEANSGRCEDVDECQLSLDNCNRSTEICLNTQGSYRCWQVQCPDGYRANVVARTCEDINECAEETHNCSQEETCLNHNGRFSCVPRTVPQPPPTPPPCPTGYRYDPSDNVCRDIDECSEGLQACDVTTEECLNVVGSYQCIQRRPQCPPGFRMDITFRACVDVDECAEGRHDCTSGLQICQNTHGGFHCLEERLPTCAAGFKYNVEMNQCLDVDECAENSHSCNRDTELCSNYAGGFRCLSLAIDRTCAFGLEYSDVARTCVDINECQTNQHNCQTSQRCDNTVGSFTCIRLTGCGTGYTLNAHSSHCEDDDECLLGTHNCGPAYVCRNTLGSFRCDRKTCPPDTQLVADGRCVHVSCGTGMEPDPLSGKCVDINECNTPDVCRRNQRCLNTHGSYDCRDLLHCGGGYEMDDYGSRCIDIDECSRGTHDCRSNQQCINRQGGYMCQCPIGYSMSAQDECEDVDECNQFYGKACASNSACRNTPGSYICDCNEGFKMGEHNRTCVDVDECQQYGTVCQHGCINTWGSYQCTCLPGYVQGDDKRTCNDVDECELYKGRGNLCVGICVNDPGSFSCMCPAGFKLGTDRRTCQDIDECQQDNVCKGPDQSCLNTRGSYKCNTLVCPPTYVKDVNHKNRCKRESTTCHENDAECIKQPLSYSFNYLTFVSQLPIPPSGYVNLFTMRGPPFTDLTSEFSLELREARAPPDVDVVTREYFQLKRTAFNQAVISLVKGIKGPQEIELDLLMSLYRGSQLGGTALAKVFVYVSAYEF